MLHLYGLRTEAPYFSLPSPGPKVELIQGGSGKVKRRPQLLASRQPNHHNPLGGRLFGDNPERWPKMELQGPSGRHPPHRVPLHGAPSGPAMDACLPSPVLAKAQDGCVSPPCVETASVLHDSKVRKPEQLPLAADPGPAMTPRHLKFEKRPTLQIRKLRLHKVE